MENIRTDMSEDIYNLDIQIYEFVREGGGQSSLPPFLLSVAEAAAAATRAGCTQLGKIAMQQEEEKSESENQF